MPEDQKPNRIMHADGLANALTGMSGTQDRTSYHQFVWDYMRPDEELTAIWAGGGIGRKICTARPDDMLRAWISIPEDKEGKILAAKAVAFVRERIFGMAEIGMNAAKPRNCASSPSRLKPSFEVMLS